MLLEFLLFEILVLSYEMGNKWAQQFDLDMTRTTKYFTREYSVPILISRHK
jgi:hypothetical protein